VISVTAPPALSGDALHRRYRWRVEIMPTLADLPNMAVALLVVLIFLL
jgi:hypothetical protein